MPELTLKIENVDEISLPVSLIESALSFEEIGVLAYLTCLIENTGNQNAMMRRANDEKGKTILSDLRDRGIVSITASGNNVRIEIDCEKANK